MPGYQGAASDLVHVNRIGVKQEPGKGKIAAADMNHILMAACRDNQTAADAFIGGRPNGAWTWGIVQALKVVQNSSVREFFYASALAIKGQYEQRPVLEGRLALRGRPFLGGMARRGIGIPGG